MPKVRVEGHDQVYRFPDDTPREEITRQVRNHLYPRRNTADTVAVAGSTAGMFAPGAGIADALGVYPTGEGSNYPSLMENVLSGNIADAGYQTLGALGDFAHLAGPVGVGIGMTMKAPRAARMVPRIRDAAHATVHEFEQFGPQNMGRSRAIDTQQGEAYFFTNRPATGQMVAMEGEPADALGRMSVKYADLDMQNPLEWNPARWGDPDEIDTGVMANLIRRAREMGNDGVIYRSQEMGDTYVVFKPEQINVTRTERPFSDIQGGGAGRLPMDDAARMARAEEQGYDTSQVWYRGTTERGASQAEHSFEAGRGVFLSDNPDVADIFRYPREYGEVLWDVPPGDLQEIYTRASHPLELTGREAQLFTEDTAFQSRILRQAAEAGHDSIIARNVREGVGDHTEVGTTLVVLDPTMVRQTTARFDPDSKHTPKLLGGVAAGAVGLGLAQDTDGEK